MIELPPIIKQETVLTFQYSVEPGPGEREGANSYYSRTKQVQEPCNMLVLGLLAVNGAIPLSMLTSLIQ